MAKQNRTILKTYFQQGDIPTQGQYVNLIDSQLNLNDGETQLISGSVSASSFVSSADITIAGNVSSSGNLIIGHITASGGTSTTTLTSTNVTTTNITGSNISASIKLITDKIITGSAGNGIILVGDITASNDISGSATSRLTMGGAATIGGALTAGAGTFTTLNASSHITSSGNISSSGNFDLTGNANIDGNLDVDGTTNLDETNIDGNLKLGLSEPYTTTITGSILMQGVSGSINLSKAAYNLTYGGSVNISSDSSVSLTTTFPTILPGNSTDAGTVNSSIVKATSNVLANCNIKGIDVSAACIDGRIYLVLYLNASELQGTVTGQTGLINLIIFP